MHFKRMYKSNIRKFITDKKNGNFKERQAPNVQAIIIKDQNCKRIVENVTKQYKNLICKINLILHIIFYTVI